MLGLLGSLDEPIRNLDQAAEKAAAENPLARLLMTQPGVGPITALAFVLTIGDFTRFQRSKQLASYPGLIPRTQLEQQAEAGIDQQTGQPPLAHVAGRKRPDRNSIRRKIGRAHV